MPTFATLGYSLKEYFCRPSVRKLVVDVVHGIKRGEYRVPGWSPNGVGVVLNSSETHFRTLYLVKAERCDSGELHTDDAVYSIAPEEDMETIMSEIYDAAADRARQEYDEKVDLDENDIHPPDTFVGGVLIYTDPEFKEPQALYFTHASMGIKHSLALVASAIGQYFKTDDSDEPGDDAAAS
ncbi:MAG: hypothetical protein HY975_02615 [Candidatus Kerfeldbacteria bacterium]|nr:hypothetical protein [Candidatus Kerfeldbacteria bacterium]